MKLTKEYFEQRELFDPIPKGMDSDDYYRQAKEYLAEDFGVDPRELDPPSDDYTMKSPRVDELVPWDKRKREVMAAIRRNQKHKYHCDVACRLQEYADAGVLTRELGMDVRPERERRKLLRIRARYSKYLVPGYQMDELFSAMLEAPDDETRDLLNEQAEGDMWDPDNEHFVLPKVVAPLNRKKYPKRKK